MLTIFVSVILKIITIIKSSCSHQDGRFSSDSDVILLGGRRGQSIGVSALVNVVLEHALFLFSWFRFQNNVLIVPFVKQ